MHDNVHYQGSVSVNINIFLLNLQQLICSGKVCTSGYDMRLVIPLFCNRACETLNYSSIGIGFFGPVPIFFIANSRHRDF